jgi:cysteine desulfurase family protein
MQRIYFDNAATSWPKPSEVYTAVMEAMQVEGAAAGRGGYASAVRAGSRVDQARMHVARVLGATVPERIIFTQNGTDALNLALHGILRDGDHVVTTVVEHNSVLRPLAWAERYRGVQVTHVGCNDEGGVSIDEMRDAVTSSTRLVVVSHASNVTGAIQPIQEIVDIAHHRGALVLVDAAQSVGHVPLEVASHGWDLVACSGHKGLLGPLGTGILYVAPGVEEQLLPVRQGGTGTESRSELPPDALPERYEAGNLNVPALAGLAAAADFVARQGVGQVIDTHEWQLTQYLLELLATLPQITIYGPPPRAIRTPVVSLRLEGYDPQELASILDSAAGIETRAGLHCAPRMHQALRTEQFGGTLRLSLGRFNTMDQVDQAVEVFRQLCQ